MPAPRNCRSCGSPLLGDVRWCLHCHEPVTEFAARAPLHDGGFVAAPIHTGPNSPHWSRTEKSATTLGLAGRVTLTVLFFALVLIAGATGYFINVIVSPIVGFMFLSSVWRKAWVVPDEPKLAPIPVKDRPDQFRSPLTAGMWIWRITWMSLALIGILLIAYGSDEARFGALSVGTLLGLWWFFREFLNS